MIPDKRHRLFRRLSLTTLVAVYFLILVGGVVRSTGSGMGCPDWPRCFGEWIPPTTVSELPDNYRDVYAAYRNEKNIRFAGMLSMLGMNSTAEQILEDESILVEAEFNVYKTWTEYVNRLIGAIIGLLILATMVVSFSFRRHDRTIVGLSVASFILVVFQGWVGSVVVSTNLLPWMVTLHMSIALLIVTVLIAIVFRAWREKIVRKGDSKHKTIFGIVLLCLAAIAFQIIMGTQVRERLDMIAAELGQDLRETWLNRVGATFLVHRSFSLIILLLHVYLGYRLINVTGKKDVLNKGARILLILVLIEIASGGIMAYFGIPPFVQPIHLLVSTLIFGLLVFITLNVREVNRTIAVE